MQENTQSSWVDHPHYWQTTDFYAKRCHSLDIGSLKPEYKELYLPKKRGSLRSSGVAIATSEDIATPTVDDANEGFLRAYARMGGEKALAEWGMDNPTEFYRLFSRMLMAKAQSGTGNVPTLVINFGGELGRVLEHGVTLSSVPSASE
jgi:hypothetical protein